MNIGIIAEFNPLHSGHTYLIKQANKYINNNGNVICVMSEFFTQRGEIAVLNGYHRAEVAIDQGCDLVLALPYRASVAFSDDFAKYSIDILAKCGITHLIFGTEIDISSFEDIYKLEQKTDIKEKIITLSKSGISYPKIMQKIFNLPNENPNFILAYSYFKAIKQSKKNIQLIPIKRQGQTLNESKLDNNIFLSATAIRNNLNNNKINDYLSPLMLQKLKNNVTLNEERFFELLKYKILASKLEDLKKIYDVAEGLENRIYQAAIEATSHENLIELINTKRYSKKRIQRILLHILTNSTKKEMQKEITDVRILAVKKEKTSLIREINNAQKIKLHQKLKKENAKSFDQDIRVSRIYNTLLNDSDIFKENIRIID